MTYSNVHVDRESGRDGIFFHDVIQPPVPFYLSRGISADLNPSTTTTTTNTSSSNVPNLLIRYNSIKIHDTTAVMPYTDRAGREKTTCCTTAIIIYYIKLNKLVFDIALIFILPTYFLLFRRSTTLRIKRFNRSSRIRVQNEHVRVNPIFNVCSIEIVYNDYYNWLQGNHNR